MATKGRKKKTAGGKKADEGILPGMQVEFICDKCGTHLAWALPSFEMKCPRCGRWISNKNRARKEEDLMLPPDDDQLILF